MSKLLSFMETHLNTIDHLFRHEYGRLVSGLTANFGVENIEFVEDAVQEALLKAMQMWGFGKIPNNPTSWLFMVARNKMIDLLRRNSKSQSIDLNHEEIHFPKELALESEIEDEQLKMIFACCNPAISTRDSLLLSLKLIGGFSVAEIARALLIKEEAAKKSLHRAKLKFREEVGHLYVPKGDELELYMDRVLKVIYLIFNEGYATSKGEELINEDLCGEALRLALLVSKRKDAKQAAIFALLSLMCFKISRFNARINQGNLVTLEFQNRQDWISEYIEWGYYYYHQATLQRQYDSYFLECSIEFEYHIAKNYESINWDEILRIYGRILQQNSSVNLQLNYLIIKSKVHPKEEVLEELVELESQLVQSRLFYAFKSELESSLGDLSQSKASLEKAILLSTNKVEKKHLQDKLGYLQAIL